MFGHLPCPNNDFGFRASQQFPLLSVDIWRSQIQNAGFFSRSDDQMEIWASEPSHEFAHFLKIPFDSFDRPSFGRMELNSSSLKVDFSKSFKAMKPVGP